MKQYSKRTAVLHWLIFLLVVAAFFLGHELDEAKDNAQKLSLLPAHFLIGNLVLLLTVLRIYFRKKDGEPAPANASALLNKVASATHVLLNITLMALALSGLATAATSGVFAALQASDPNLIPDFEHVRALEFHELFLGVTLALVALHVAAALYHQFVVGDGLLRRIMIKRFMD